MHLLDRKSTRLNSSHLVISYAVFCLKKKQKNPTLRPATTYRAHARTHLQHHRTRSRSSRCTCAAVCCSACVGFFFFFFFFFYKTAPPPHPPPPPPPPLCPA